MVTEVFEVIDEGMSGLEIAAPECLCNAVLRKSSRGKGLIMADGTALNQFLEFGHDRFAIDLGIEHIPAHAFHKNDDDIAPVGMAVGFGHAHIFGAFFEGRRDLFGFEIVEQQVLIGTIIGGIECIGMQIPVEWHGIGR